MEIVMHILAAFVVLYILYTYTSIRKAYTELYETYEQLLSESFYNEKDCNKLNDELTCEIEQLKEKLEQYKKTSDSINKQDQVEKLKPVRKKAVSKKTPTVE